MSNRSAKKLARRARLLSLAPLAMWGWKYRHELMGALGLVKRAPKQVLAGGAGDLVTEARVRQALARDELTRGNRDIEVVGVREGRVELRAATASAGTVARAVAEFVPGVKEVSLSSPAGAVVTSTAPSSATMAPATGA